MWVCWTPSNVFPMFHLLSTTFFVTLQGLNIIWYQLIFLLVFVITPWFKWGSYPLFTFHITTMGMYSGRHPCWRFLLCNSKAKPKVHIRTLDKGAFPSVISKVSVFEKVQLTKNILKPKIFHGRSHIPRLSQTNSWKSCYLKSSTFQIHYTYFPMLLQTC